MAQSPISVSSRPVKAVQSAQAAAKRSASSSGGASFAAVMAKEQANQSAAAETTARRVKGRQTVARAASAGLPIRGAILAGRSPSDMLRTQAFNNGPVAANSTLNAGRGNSGSNLRVQAAADNGRGFALARTDFIHTAPRVARADRTVASKSRRAEGEKSLGKLSAKFESGSDGIAAIGYDSTGGTSYGKYQIASKVGSMKSFLAFLDKEAPDLAGRLRKAGPANTGGRRGGMPNEWRAIAKEQPERFERLQESYIRETHYKPALDAIAENTGIDPDNLSSAMREVIWSTAVQHGPAGAARIFARADSMSGKAREASYERKMITNVYNVRAGQFGSSTPQVRNAVRNRFREERQLALNMLNGDASQNVA